MSTPTSRLAYSDCFDLMDRALTESKGARVKIEDQGEAWRLRLRLHAARQINRRDNADTYEVDHPMHGRSIYDDLTIRIRHGWLYIEKTSAAKYEVESLGDENGDDQTLTGDSGAIDSEAPATIKVQGRRA